uniref:Uncharacterized protein n=1 Tax=Arundo donax TaxID=35708 RepID=A0A0A8Y0H1_ARUDO
MYLTYLNNVHLTFSMTWPVAEACSFSRTNQNNHNEDLWDLFTNCLVQHIYCFH